MSGINRKIKVALVTPVFNRRDITVQCLRSLARISDENLEIQTIIVDDGSSDGTSEAIKAEFPHVEIIEGDGTLWFSEGTNVGVRLALKNSPDYVLTFNDDSVFDADFLRYMIETAEKHPKSIVGALLLLWDIPHKIFQTSPVYEVWSGGWRHWQQQTVWTIPKKPWKVDVIAGNCVLFPARVFIEEGFMDSAHFPAFGDTEFTPRLKRKGWTLLIEPRARVFCQPNNLPEKVSKMSLKQKFNGLFVNLTHTHNLRRRFYANLRGAPSRLQGITAYFVFFIRVLLNRNVEKSDYNKGKPEKPLSEVFASAVVNE